MGTYVSIGFRDILMSNALKPGLIKCRLIHMDGRSVVQPDVLFGDTYQKRFFVPKFFDPNQIGFIEDVENDFCRFTLVTENAVTLRVGFFGRDRIKTCPDGSVIYRCKFVRVDGLENPKPTGIWRKRAGAFQLRLFHHTDEVGYQGISSSKEIWGSRRNIQGNLWLNNIAYGYFTSLDRIRTEEDLLEIAMSSSGLTGLVPTNAPFHPLYARMVQIPLQTAAQRSHPMTFWIDCEILSPNHLWIHRPMNRPAYYEIVLPKVFRVGVRPDTNLLIKGQEILVPPANQRVFQYVIVGDADTHEGLAAPYHEEETTSVAAVEQLEPDDDIIAFWKRHANTNQFDGRVIEHARLSLEDDDNESN